MALSMSASTRAQALVPWVVDRRSARLTGYPTTSCGVGMTDQSPNALGYRWHNRHATVAWRVAAPGDVGPMTYHLEQLPRRRSGPWPAPARDRGRAAAVTITAHGDVCSPVSKRSISTSQRASSVDRWRPHAGGSPSRAATANSAERVQVGVGSRYWIPGFNDREYVAGCIVFLGIRRRRCPEIPAPTSARRRVRCRLTAQVRRTSCSGELTRDFVVNRGGASPNSPCTSTRRES